MLLYKARRELFRVYKELVLYCPACNRSFKLSVIRRWKDKYCMSADFDPLRPFHERPISDIAIVLDLSFTSGFGQTLHPDVIYAGGWGAGNWQYIMTVTPFPYSNDYYENPEFLVSDDGINWCVPKGGMSPLVKTPEHIGYSYNSDPALLLDSGHVYIVFRDLKETRDAVYIALHVLSSDDGVQWTSPHLIMKRKCKKDSASVLMSPSLLLLDELYVLWYVECDGDGFAVYRLCGYSLEDLSQKTKTVINGLHCGEYPWHMDVVKDGERLLMAFCTSTRNRDIIFAESFDYGMTWNVTGDRMTCEKYSFSGTELYKPSLCKDEHGNWRLYYSARLADGAWFTAVTYVDDLIND